MDLTAPPPPLTPRQRALSWSFAALCASSRFAALARTLWDWDEALFCLGMRSYDVTSHHPHPPGFPIYIAAAKLLRFFTHDDFRALQSVNLIAGICLFPVVFLLARELRFRFETALVAATLCAFFPNVWFFGGGAFSDVPSIVLVVFAVAMYFRGCRDSNAYLIATFLLALSLGIRPQNLLVGLFPGLLATWYRVRVSWRDPIFALLLGVVISGAAYGSAMVATGGYEPYMQAVKAHGEYITRVDSFRVPSRPPLWRLFDRFFIKQYQSSALSIIISIFVLISAAGAIRNRDRRIGYLALAFGPFAIAVWLMLDRFSINRFSIGYIPMFALLAADGISRVTRGRREAELTCGFALAGAFAIWAWPALAPVRNEVAPSVAGVEAMKKLDPRRVQLFVAFPMAPFVETFAPYVSHVRVYDERGMPLSAGNRPPYLLTEGGRGLQFTRERGRLWNIARRHYFEVSLDPLSAAQLPELVSGWYPPERSEWEEWRWMSSTRAIVKLPAAAGKAKLRIYCTMPSELERLSPEIAFKLNNRVIDRFTANSSITREYEDLVPAPNGAPNVLEIEVSRTIRKEDDARELGLQLRFLSWGG